MNRLTKELRVIPKAAWIVAWSAYVCFAVPLFLFVLPKDPEIGTWPRWAQALFAAGSCLFMVALIGLIGYIYGDAKRRQLRYVMWTLLAIFIPNAIGIVLYFILRDYSVLRDPTKPCPRCANRVQAGFPFCPHCGSALQAACPNCGKPVEPGWTNCAHCGHSLPATAPRATQDHRLAT
jgi:hypothetical protein